FTFKSTQYGPVESRLRKEILSTDAVGLHVRRGDYLLPEGAHMHIIGMDYYRRAAELISERVLNPHFFVFSDDIQWCARTLDIRYPHTFVVQDQPSERWTAADFRLMTLCKHFVIANSTFSWWAAWLGSHQDKIVVAPSEWIHNDTEGSKAITPVSWVRV